MEPELQAEAERTALRIILSNVVAHLAVESSSDPVERRARLKHMNDQCRLAAEHAMAHVPGADRSRLIDHLIRYLDEFYKSVTIP
jgi:hypothetical protein